MPLQSTTFNLLQRGFWALLVAGFLVFISSALSITSIGSMSVSSTPTSSPAKIRVSGISFVDILHGWALGWACDADEQCSIAMRATTDGGRTWRISSAPNGKQLEVGQAQANRLNGLRFANTKDGWIFGSYLFSTHDGGKTWKDEKPFGEIVAIEPKGKSVWAIERTCANGCAFSLLTSSIKGKDGSYWRKLRLQLPPQVTSVQLVRINERTAWILAHDPPTGRRSTLIATSDGGRTWPSRNLPDKDMFMRLSVLDTRRIWLAASGQPGVGYQGKAVYNSTDTGRSWRAVAVEPMSPETKKVGNLPIAGYFYGDEGNFVPTSSKEAWMVIRNTEMLYHTTDGGRSWDVNRKNMWNGGDSPFVLFCDVKHGWVAVGDRVYRTVDGGVSWQEVKLP